MNDEGHQLEGAAVPQVTGDPAFEELRPGLEVLRLLGTGSTSNVYLARERDLQRLVAVKIMRPELTRHRVRSRRFEREAQSAARLRHPHVTAVHRVGRLSTGTPYIVMEYIDGRRLDDIIATSGAFQAEEGRTLLCSVADALAAAHDYGIVHRDLCPNNVFIENRTNRAVLSDFGIAGRIDSGTEAATQITELGKLLGDPHYMSPEQLRGEPATAQSDVYSFGVLAYEVLTGHGPFERSAMLEIIMAHLNEQPPPLRTLETLQDAAWVRILERCLAKEPNRRPTACELAKVLDAGAGAGSGAAETGLRSPLEQFFAEMRRRRVYRVLVGYGAAAIAVLGTADVINDAFELPARVYQGIVLVTLAGFPAAFALSWVYDVSERGIERTPSTESGHGGHRLIWAAFALSVLAALATGWLLLR